MKKILGTIIKVLGWLILLAAFASIGFATDNPGLMVPLYFMIFLIIFALVLLYNMKRQRRTNTSPRYLKQLKRVLGVILVLAGLLMPYFFFRGAGFTAGIFILLIVITIVLVALAILAIRLINAHKLVQNVGGYILLIAICSMPAILMMQYDKSYNALGTAYYAALIISVLTWSGVSMLAKPGELQQG